ncbi:Mur ligase [Kalaharituber pfeilii]|nr:Mur ligase [Kalaharituber pfeilii]
MIDLGLSRIRQLVRLLQYPFPWRAIHVAGTNGKGSVCAYISSVLHHSNLRCGRFTSPHLIDRWDCITLDDRSVSRATFLEAEKCILELNRKHGIGATEFEVLTATAFELFSRSKVDVAVIEVGMGGRLDATNVFEHGEALVTVVTKIGMDHEATLGSTLGEIARQKAGIFKPGVPIVADGTNDAEALKVVEEVAREVGAGEMRRAVFGEKSHDRKDGRAHIVTVELGALDVRLPLNGAYQNQNAQVALEALAIASRSLPSITPETAVRGIEATRWLGRLDWRDLSPIVPELNGTNALLDGAHNPQAAHELAAYVDGLRHKDGVNWVIAASRGKNIEEILRIILRAGDKVCAVRFGAVDGMPWVEAAETQNIAWAAKAVLGDEGLLHESEDVLAGLEAAARDALPEKKLVVAAGSLYVDTLWGAFFGI